MNLTWLKNRKWNYVALAFAFPFIGMLFVMLISQYAPFGKYSILYSDMYHQYYPFFVNFREALLSGDSLLYNWSVGLGMDYLGLYSYYLASPLNLLSIFVPKGWLLGYFSFLMPLKLGLASMFFAIFLKKTFHKDDLSVSMFGCFYGLCAWALGYQWNIMWLDTFALLPLVILGMVSLLRDRKFILYSFTLFLSIWANYYIGLFTCIFVFLLFFCYEICRWQGFGRFLSDLGVIALFSLLAIGLTAILELPTLSALQNTQSSVNKYPATFQLNIVDEDTWMGLLNAMRQVAGNMNGGLTPTFKEGLPNLYCGVISTSLAFLYLTCRQIKLRDKICCVVLLLFFNVSFIIRQLDYIWHGFHFTNMIPYRFSFLYSFVILYMAYGAWVHRESLKLWQVITSALLCLGILACTNDYKDPVFWAYNGVFLLLYFSVFIAAAYTQNKPVSLPDDPSEDVALASIREETEPAQPIFHFTPSTTAGMLLAIMAIELILNLVNFGVNFSGTSVSNYPKGTHSSAAAIHYMNEQEKDNPFFRTETTHTQTLNDGALNGYYGITTFTSSANVKVTEFMKALGYGAKNTYNRYSFEESSPVCNLFLGLKYMLERDGKVEENPYFDGVFSTENVHLLENNAYLPLGFLANSQLLNANFKNPGEVFVFQNQLIRQAAGVYEDVWYVLPETCLTINGQGPTLNAQLSTGYCSYSTEDGDQGTVSYAFTADKEGFMCISLNLSKKNSYTVLLNGNELYKETYSLPQSIAVSMVRPGDVVEIQLNCKANEKGTIHITSAILNDTVFRQAYDILVQSTLDLTHFSNTRVEGDIHCNRDGVLYTSIPQNGNWSATVDGEPAEIVLIGNAMCGLLLTEGDHTVSFHYHNAAFSLGWKISLTCLFLLVAIYLIVYHPISRRKKGKYER